MLRLIYRQLTIDLLRTVYPFFSLLQSAILTAATVSFRSDFVAGQAWQLRTARLTVSKARFSEWQHFERRAIRTMRRSADAAGRNTK